MLCRWLCWLHRSGSPKPTLWPWRRHGGDDEGSQGCHWPLQYYVSVPTPPPTTCRTLGQLESSSVSTQSQLASTFISLFQVGCFLKETSWLFLQRDRFQVGCFFKETERAFPVTLQKKLLFRCLWLRSRIRAQKSQPALWVRTALGHLSVNTSLCPILIPNVYVTLSALSDWSPVKPAFGLNTNFRHFSQSEVTGSNLLFAARAYGMLRKARKAQDSP